MHLNRDAGGALLELSVCPITRKRKECLQLPVSANRYSKECSSRHLCSSVASPLSASSLCLREMPFKPIKSSYFFLISILILLALDITLSISTGESCNETVCGSIVSKCQLLKHCNCPIDSTNATCTHECFKCLGFLYVECCSCVDVCPKMNVTHDLVLSSQSHVGDLPEPTPLLFDTIAEEEDDLKRWTVEKFPVRMSFVTTGQEEHQLSVVKKLPSADTLDHREDVTVNCTVLFMADCMSYNKCKMSCTSMGASAYRWFHDGCCQCVGPLCINYGSSESKCSRCPYGSNKEDGEMRVDNVKKQSAAQSESDALSSAVNKEPEMESIDHETAPATSEMVKESLPRLKSDIIDDKIELA